jgi:hypothetical protein
MENVITMSEIKAILKSIDNLGFSTTGEAYIAFMEEPNNWDLSTLTKEQFMKLMNWQKQVRG